MSDKQDIETTVTPDIGSPPATSQDTKIEGTQEPTYTQDEHQAELNRIAAKTRKEAKDTERKAILEELGITDLDSLKTTLSEAQKRKEAEMSDLEKLQGEFDSLKTSLAERDNKITELEQKRVDDMRDSGLLRLLDNKALNPTQVLSLMKSEKQDDVIALVQDGKFNDEAATKLVTDYASANSYLFKSGAPGSPSNSDGRIPGTIEIQKEAQKQIRQRFGKL